VDNAERSLREYLHGQRLHHALILSGGNPDRRKELAVEMAKSLFCEKRKTDPAGCGKCSACSRVTNGAHPDLVVFDSKPTDVIKIEQIRQFCTEMEIGATSARYKIGILNNADRMNVPAANAFLKTLEEPGENRLLWLLASQPNAFLPTIRSRCLEMSLGPSLENAEEATAESELAREFSMWTESGKVPAGLSEVEKDREKGVAWVRYLQTELRNAAVGVGGHHQKFFSRWEPYDLIQKFDKAVELEGRLRSQANYALMLELFIRSELS